ncbi:MAG TPA: hypothetical protein VMF89_01465 [Polyangiales bacterium]|nr:hypothetical protein [Polyangiales bacterium]
MSLVLRSCERSVDAYGVAESGIDLRGVVRRAIVDEQSEWSLAGRGNAICESRHERWAVLFIADIDADCSIGRSVYDELEIDMQHLAIDHDFDLLAICNPLGSREEGLERSA